MFATKPQIALQQINAARQAGVTPGVVLADAAYGDDTQFRDDLTELGLPYVVGVRPATTVWTSDRQALPPKPWSGRGAKPTLLRTAPGHEPIAVKELAMSSTMRYEQVTWRDGSNAALSSRFACLRIRAAHRTHLSKSLRAEEWLLVQWPDGDAEPARYWFSTGPADATLEQLVFVAKMRWRIERDYEDLKQEFGLSHYEGRGWTGFHHHATLCIAAYAFLMYRRLRYHDVKKRWSIRSAYPTQGSRPSRTNSAYSATSRIPSGPCVCSSRAPSPKHCRGAHAAHEARVEKICDTVELVSDICLPMFYQCLCPKNILIGP